ncbi:hypothetical protein Bca52824_006896 [Brassica carinata]|uniref:UBA domain-containing protein n=1 Tax=Brassica carinata TaxID=52824 RepID=A0A8X7W591_BRACI|nr:hypothetical protein Bca52824_006896 [Brassica carinata]
MAGVSLKCGDCGALLKSVEEAQEHAEITSHSNFAESTEAVLNLVCTACSKPCRSKTESDLHTKRTGHTEFVDKTMETVKPISLEAPKPAMETDNPDGSSGSGDAAEEMVVPEVDKNILEELEGMGFPKARATRALHYSGNASLEAAVNWVVEHENDPDVDELPKVPANSNVGPPKPALTPEEVKIKAQELRERARKKKEEEEKRMEREREKERIRIGKELLEAKRIEEDNERKRIILLRKAEKEEERRAREKIRQKVEEDKAERRRKLGLPAEDPAAAKPSVPVVEEKKSSLPIRPATKTEQMRECLRSLKQAHKEDDAKVKRAFQTLLTYMGNVAKNPDEEKFRKIRLTNQTFQDRVGSLRGGIEFMELCGFEKMEGGEFLFLPRDKIDAAIINSAGTELNSAINNPFFGRVLNNLETPKRNAFTTLLRFDTTSPATISFPTGLRSSPDESHFISLIHSCKDTVTLRRVYAQILRRNLLSSRVVSQLVSCSSLLKSPDYSLSIFRYSNEKNLFVFNALIRGLTENARFECSLRHFILMLRFGVRPDRLTFPFVLKSNSKLGFRWLGKALHAATVKDCVDCDSFVRVSLIDMYGKTKGLKYARQVFDESPERLKKESILLWNVLINGYCRAKDMQMATTLFGSMPERNSGSWSTLIKGYVDGGELNRAKQCFELMPEKNVVSWTTLINGFSQNGDYETAISIYFEMVEKGMKPNEYTVAAVLSACSKSGALESGIRVHGYVLDNGFKLDRAIGTALVDMYAKCGEVDCAANVFSNMGDKDILSWTAMIQGWAIHGRFQQAILCFRQMMYSGEKPDEVVFLAVLTACLNSGEVELGINFFDSMRLDYAIEPTLKHYVVVVDLLGRAGKLNEAHELIESMPINPDLTTWAALYRACKAHNSNRKGEMVSQNLLEIDPELRGSYVFLDKRHVEKRRLPLQKIVKERCKGWSYIELDGQLNKFLAGDDSHKQVQEIGLKLEEIVSLAVESGYILGDFYCQQLDNGVVGIRSAMIRLSQLVRKNDEKLWRHLEITTKVNPQFYAFRWITLLFTQGFSFLAFFDSWDALLSDSEGPLFE